MENCSALAQLAAAALPSASSLWSSSTAAGGPGLIKGSLQETQDAGSAQPSAPSPEDPRRFSRRSWSPRRSTGAQAAHCQHCHLQHGAPQGGILGPLLSSIPVDSKGLDGSLWSPNKPFAPLGNLPSLDLFICSSLQGGRCPSIPFSFTAFEEAAGGAESLEGGAL